MTDAERDMLRSSAAWRQLKRTIDVPENVSIRRSFAALREVKEESMWGAIGAVVLVAVVVLAMGWALRNTEQDLLDNPYDDEGRWE